MYPDISPVTIATRNVHTLIIAVRNVHTIPKHLFLEPIQISNIDIEQPENPDVLLNVFFGFPCFTGNRLCAYAMEEQRLLL